MRGLFARYALLAVLAWLGSLLWSALHPKPIAPALVPLAAWQLLLGRIDGRSCPSYPVCSAYAAEAIERHGLLLGSWLAIDRLIHESGDWQSGPRIVVDGELRIHDPLQRNDFWLEER